MRSLIAPTLIVLCLGTFVALQAGPIDPPPGAISPTGRFGPKVDVLTLPGNGSNLFVISQPGSYYLSANITGVSGLHGIFINSHDVTLDLNGFSVNGVPGSLDGIRTNNNVQKLRIRNGNVASWGGDGIEASGQLIRLEGLTVHANQEWGINLSSFGHKIVDCLVRANGQNPATSTGGIKVDADTVIDSCISQSNEGVLIETGTKCLIVNNMLVSNTVGLVAGSNSLIRGNLAANVGSNTTSGSTVIDNRGL